MMTLRLLWIPALLLGLCALSSPSYAETRKSSRTITPARVTIGAVGDILFGRYRATTGKRYPVAGKHPPFAGVESVLRAPDITFGNLECPVMEEPRTLKLHRSLTFRANPAELDHLVDAGFDVISLANNHTLNLGFEGAPKSRAHVEDKGMRAIGAGATPDEAAEPTVFEKNGLRIAFAAYTIWTNGRKAVGKEGAVALLSRESLERDLPAAVKRVRKDTNADFVVISLHWGIEKEPHPERSQIRAARAAIDAGADIILGHHPHVVQDIERYQGGIIVYSLGNFLFDNPTLAQRETLVFTAALVQDSDGRRVEDATVHPAIIDRKKHTPKLSNNRTWVKRLGKLARGIRIAQ